MFNNLTKTQLAFLLLGILLVIIIIISMLFGNKVKLNYEIDIESADTAVDMLGITRVDGIRCGSVDITLGQVIDISPYTIENETEINGSRVLQLLAPSKKYELVVIGYADYYRVYEIRSTVPSVYCNKGFTIGDTTKDIKKVLKIPSRKNVTYKDKGVEIRMEFISGILVVMDMRCT